jgi:hypothetical protein
MTFFGLVGALIRAVVAFFDEMSEYCQNQPKPAPQVKVRRRAPTLSSNSANAKRFVPIQDPSLLVQRRWVQNGNTYKGYYRTPYGAWKGEIVRRGHKFLVFIIDPPILQLKKHPEKSPCVNIVNRRRAEVDLRKQPKNHDIGAIILYVETLIVESFQQ